MKFTEFFEVWKAHDTVATEDILSSFLPLVRETLAAHQAGMVAPLVGLDDLFVDQQRIWFEEQRRKSPRTAPFRVYRVESHRKHGWDVVNEMHRDLDVDTGHEVITGLNVAEEGDQANKLLQKGQPAYFRRYLSWEHLIEHHDPVTDIFCLGMLLASLALQLDFHEAEDLQRFVTHRSNLFEINRSLHPVLAQTIVQMTELYRGQRLQDLSAILNSLENYRDQTVSLDVQLALDRLLAPSGPKTRTEIILPRLRDRLFDLTRRNPLLNFRSTSQTLNLTQASMPLAIHVDNIRADHLFVWDKSTQSQMAKGQSLRLNQRINFNEAMYVPSVLERLMADARRDKNEFGCSQLRLVAVFLGWANLKEKPVENFVSPLVLVPVQIVKQKGIRDTFAMEAIDSLAEINPVIRHLFRQLYSIVLPESIDLSDPSSVDDLHQLLNSQIVANEPAIRLTRIERPRLELIHEKAKRRLDQYRRSSRVAGRGASRFENIDYSYDAVNYHPLGIRLFTQRIRQPAFRIQQIVSAQHPTRHYVAPSENLESESDDATLTVERDIAIVKDGSSNNPYEWTFDLCNPTLVNLHYRRMSLVRDYEAILQQRLENPAFAAAFSDKPRDAIKELPELIAIQDRHEVVASDPTQSMAIAEARTGRSYIIQGPPGTGKSQTITNLIADFVARGKRVLFVCEKRAAIDVVYARLKQCGLSSLCCLVHDSQSDKKEFILDLKSTYEEFTAEPKSAEAEAKERKVREQILSRLSEALAPLSQFEQAMESTLKTTDGLTEVSIRELLDRCVASRDRCPAISVEEKAEVPSVVQWWEQEATLRALQTRIEHLQIDDVWSRHPLRSLRKATGDIHQVVESIRKTCQQGLEQLGQLVAAIDKCGIPTDQWSTMDRIEELLRYTEAIAVFAEGENIKLLDAESEKSAELRKGLTKLTSLKKKLATIQQQNQYWRAKLSPDDTRFALGQARKFETNFLRWLSPAWWKLRSVMSRGYDFKQHKIRPSWVQVLEGLEGEHAADEKFSSASQSLTEQMQLALEPEEMRERLAEWKGIYSKLPAWIASIHSMLVESPSGSATVRNCQEIAQRLQQLSATVESMLAVWRHHSPLSLQQELAAIVANVQELPKVADILENLDSLPSRLGQWVRRSDLTIQQMEAAVEHQGWSNWLASHPEVERFSSNEHQSHVKRLVQASDLWLASNAAAICRQVRDRFLEHLRPDAVDRSLWKRFQQGRKVLEHEFGKTMRYRAIRDLVEGDSGLVVRDLKPIWLMSPLSVSDTLPLDTQFVDVVIFDEASQVRLEDAIPTLFRGVQTIIVGDTMQLPPTNFFAQKSVETELVDLVETVDEASDDEAIQYDLSSDSLLSHSGKSMDSTMLGWHYRSRSESLISFSNWAFYDGRLLTVPDPRRSSAIATSTEKKQVEVRESRTGYEVSSQQAKNASDTNSEILLPDWLDRPISFHLLGDGRYVDRRNEREAEYIARLVADCFARQSDLSIGIIAFSEAQQSEIERALEERARQDEAFAVRYEQELQREDNGQFVGLLVKNLENIQGDERDVILLSVCYGPNPLGKISMNFGPINRDGGEKRLNVAFSRAKRNMGVISSMQYGQITNDYNTGPNCLKQYLRYAQQMSSADIDGAEATLRQLSRVRDRADDVEVELAPVVKEITAALRARGFGVVNSVGQSHFRVDIAVYREGDDRYKLGILVDSPAAYRESDSWERDLMRPQLLRDFGWNIVHVLAKDWLANPTGELNRILAM